MPVEQPRRCSNAQRVCQPAALRSVCIPGDPVEAVLLALEAAERVFGVDMNSRGYKVPKGCGVIQGDGISIEMLDSILQAVMAKGYSAQVHLLSDTPWELSLPVDQTSFPASPSMCCTDVCMPQTVISPLAAAQSLSANCFLYHASQYRCHAVRPWPGVYACPTGLMLHVLCVDHDLIS